MKETEITAESKQLLIQALFGKFNPERPNPLGMEDPPNKIPIEANELLLDAYQCLVTTGEQKLILKACLSSKDAASIARIVFAATIYQKNGSWAWLKTFRTPLDRWLNIFTDTQNISNTIHRTPGKGKVWNEDLEPIHKAFAHGLMLGLFQAAVWRDMCLSTSGTFESDFVDFIIDIFPLNSDYYCDERTIYNPLYLQSDGNGFPDNQFQVALSTAIKAWASKPTEEYKPELHPIRKKDIRRILAALCKKTQELYKPDKLLPFVAREISYTIFKKSNVPKQVKAALAIC